MSPRRCKKKVHRCLGKMYKNITTAISVWTMFILLAFYFDVNFVAGFEQDVPITKIIMLDYASRPLLSEDEIAPRLMQYDSEEEYGRCDILQDVINYEVQELGVPFSVQAEIAPLGEERQNIIAYFSPVTKKITFNEYYIEQYDMEQMLEVCLHEVFHSYEYALSQSLDLPEDLVAEELCEKQKAYRENFDNYVEGHLCDEENLHLYREQIVEADSDAYGEQRILYYKWLIENDV